MLLKCCTQYVRKFRKLSSGRRTGKCQFSSQFQRRAVLKNVQKWKLLSHVQLFVTPWTTARQAPCRGNFPGKNAGVTCHSLHQRIFPTWGSNLGLLHWRQILYHLSHQTTRQLGSLPMLVKWKKVKSLSCVQLFATPWTVQYMEFSRPDYWSR